MNRQASVQSIESIRHFRAALQEYAEAVLDVLARLQLESQRTVDWIRSDRMTYWPAQVRAASDELAEALTQLEMKQMTLDGRDRPAATEQKQAVSRGRTRLRYVEDKVRRTRQLAQLVQHESEEYRAVLGMLAQLGETDIPQAAATLERIVTALEKYTALQAPRLSVGTQELHTGTADDEPAAGADKDTPATKDGQPASPSSGDNQVSDQEIAAQDPPAP